MNKKHKKIFRRLLVALGIWILVGAVVGYKAMPAGPRFVTKSPDSKKEFYIYRPFHRRVIKGMFYFIEWPVNIVTAVFVGPVGSLYQANYSLYVRDIASGHSCRYSPRWTGAWSPNSRWIACAGRKKDERTPLLLIETNKREEHVIPSPHKSPNWSIENIAWTVDSNIVFFRQEHTIYTVDIAKKCVIATEEVPKDEVIDLP